MRPLLLMGAMLLYGGIFAQTTQNGTSTQTTQKETVEPYFEEAHLLYKCLDSQVKMRFMKEYGINIFEQFPDYPHLTLSGNERADYEKYKKATQDYLFAHPELYKLIKAAEEAQKPSGTN